MVPDQSVTAHPHVVSLSKCNQRIASTEIVGLRIVIGPWMYDRELHFVLRLQLTELRPENSCVIAVGKMSGCAGSADKNIASFAGLAQCFFRPVWDRRVCIRTINDVRRCA